MPARRTSRLAQRLITPALMLLAFSASRAAADAVTSFEVYCDDGQHLGSITIDIANTDTRTTSSGKTLYGFHIKGGFDIDPDSSCPDANYRWIQAYIGEPTLYSWESTTAWSYDRTRSTTNDNLIADGSPFYVNLRTPGYGHTGLGYEDFPTDFLKLDGSDPNNGAEVIDFTFQTALVCYETGSNDIHMIDGFVWKFKWYTEAGTANVAFEGVEHSTAYFGDLMTAWNNDPDPGTLKNSWNLIDGGCCCEVPLPSSAWMGFALLGSVIATPRLRQRFFNTA